MFSQRPLQAASQKTHYLSLFPGVVRRWNLGGLNLYQPFHSDLCKQPRRKLTIYHSFPGGRPPLESRKTQPRSMFSPRPLQAAPRKTHYLSLFPGVVRRWNLGRLNHCQCFRATSPGQPQKTHRLSLFPGLVRRMEFQRASMFTNVFPSGLCAQPREKLTIYRCFLGLSVDGISEGSMFTNVLEQTRRAAITRKARKLRLCSPRPQRLRGALFENF